MFSKIFNKEIIKVELTKTTHGKNQRVVATTDKETVFVVGLNLSLVNSFRRSFFFEVNESLITWTPDTGNDSSLDQIIQAVKDKKENIKNSLHKEETEYLEKYLKTDLESIEREIAFLEEMQGLS